MQRQSVLYQDGKSISQNIAFAIAEHYKSLVEDYRINTASSGHSSYLTFYRVPKDINYLKIRISDHNNSLSQDNDFIFVLPSLRFADRSVINNFISYIIKTLNPVMHFDWKKRNTFNSGLEMPHKLIHDMSKRIVKPDKVAIFLFDKKSKELDTVSLNNEKEMYSKLFVDKYRGWRVLKFISRSNSNQDIFTYGYGPTSNVIGLFDDKIEKDVVMMFDYKEIKI